MALVKRSEKVAFYGVPGTNGKIEYRRMTKFTALSTSKNPKEYARQYIDEAFEQTDVTGYSPSMAYTFDQDTDSSVHEDIVKITNGEFIADDAVRTIVVVDLTSNKGGKTTAIKRDFAVIPDAEGDGTDAYTYSGTFKTKGATEVVEVTSNDGWETITIGSEEE